MANSYEGGSRGNTPGTAFDTVSIGTGVTLAFDSTQPAHGSLATLGSGPCGPGGPPRRMTIYLVEPLPWKHDDGTPCPDGLNVPIREWAEVEYPFRCRDGELIQPVLPSGRYFYLNELDETVAGYIGPPRRNS